MFNFEFLNNVQCNNFQFLTISYYSYFCVLSQVIIALQCFVPHDERKEDDREVDEGVL